MNHPFVKMLRFELKSMINPWKLNLLLSLLAFAVLTFSSGAQPPFFDVSFSSFIFFTVIVTLYSFQESTRQQFMQMYHLIPISLNTKFVTKQLISLILYPLAILCILQISIIAKNLIFGQPELISQSSQHQSTFSTLVVIWIFGHSFCTLTAIIFQKNKLLHTIQAYLVFRGLIWVLLFPINWLLGINSNPFSLISFPSTELAQIGLLLLSLLFYGLSYRIFNKRQLGNGISSIMGNRPSFILGNN